MVDKETYEERWEEHIDDLARMGYNLNKVDQDRLGEVINELKEFAEVAAENHERDPIEDGYEELEQ